MKKIIKIFTLILYRTNQDFTETKEKEREKFKDIKTGYNE